VGDGTGASSDETMHTDCMVWVSTKYGNTGGSREGELTSHVNGERVRCNKGDLVGI
jgi:hypothetical protein